MTNTSQTIILATASVLFATVDARACSSLDDLTWLLGQWEARSDKTITQESWAQVSADTFEGQGVTLAAGDRKVKGTEALRIVQMQDGIFLIAKVRSSTDAVVFRGTQCDAGGVTFENPAHDYPRKIEYLRRGDTRIDAQVGDGQEIGFTLQYHRKTDDTPLGND